MDFELQWFLIALPVAFGLGWLASRFDQRQYRRDSREAPRAYFAGLNLLLNEQQDKAIDAFIEAVQHDPETSELHFALGNLFRRRGEFERAVRVHQHLLQRADLKAADRDRAQHALAQDYMKAGLFDRAEEAWSALQKSAFASEAQRALLGLHERSRDWPRAIEAATALQALGEGSLSARLAHYHCELAEQHDKQGRADEAAAALQAAQAAAPDAPRAWVLSGQRAVRAGDLAQALATWDQLRERQPAAFLLVAIDYARAAIAADRAVDARATLQQQLARCPGVPLLEALALLDQATGQPPRATLERWVRELHERPSLAAASVVLERDPDEWPGGTLDGLRLSVEQAVAPLRRYRCAACGFEAQHYFWQCPGCLNWDSYPTQPIDTP